MILKKIKYSFLATLVTLIMVSCNNDDENPAPMQDDDTVGMEDDMMPMDDDMMAMDPDFSGTYAQVDHMGRPGINTVLSADGDIKDLHNATIPSEMETTFQMAFQTQLEGLHDAYALALGLTAEDVDYQPNILGDILNGPEDDGFTNNPVSAAVLTTVLANDVLEVAPDAPTTYFNPGAGAPTYDGGIGLTGRIPQADIIDISLILLFGGGDGARFNGEGGLPLLVSDGVGLTGTISDTFPYLSDPE